MLTKIRPAVEGPVKEVDAIIKEVLTKEESGIELLTTEKMIMERFGNKVTYINKVIKERFVKEGTGNKLLTREVSGRKMSGKETIFSETLSNKETLFSECTCKRYHNKLVMEREQ